MEGSQVVLLAVPQLLFPPPVSARQLQLRRCLATQDCIPAVVLALSLVHDAQGASQKAHADSLVVARHKKMPFGALAGASNMLYALGNGNRRPSNATTDRPDEPFPEAEALPMASNTADDAVPSANQHNQHAACRQEKADIAATKEQRKVQVWVVPNQLLSISSIMMNSVVAPSCPIPIV